MPRATDGCALILDEAVLSAGDSADPSSATPACPMTQDVYMSRNIVNPLNAVALDAATSQVAHG